MVAYRELLALTLGHCDHVFLRCNEKLDAVSVFRRVLRLICLIIFRQHVVLVVLHHKAACQRALTLVRVGLLLCD